MIDRVGELQARIEILASGLPPERIAEGSYRGLSGDPSRDIYVRGALYELKDGGEYLSAGGYYFLSTTEEGLVVRKYGHTGVLYQELKGDVNSPWFMSVVSTIKANQENDGFVTNKQLAGYRGPRAKDTWFPNPKYGNRRLSLGAQSRFDELRVDPGTMISALMAIHEPAQPTTLSAIPTLSPRRLLQFA